MFNFDFWRKKEEPYSEKKGERPLCGETSQGDNNPHYGDESLHMGTANLVAGISHIGESHPEGKSFITSTSHFDGGSSTTSSPHFDAGSSDTSSSHFDGGSDSW